MRRLPVVRHRTARQAWAKCRACRHPVEKARWHAPWLLLRTDEPRAPAQVAEVVGVSVITARAALRRWNAAGPSGLADGRAANRGQPTPTEGQRAELFAALKRRPPDGGRWTGPKAARYVNDRWGVAVAPQTGWRWLRDLGFTLQVPRPRHPRSAGPAARRRWGEKPAASAGPAAEAAPG